MAFTPSEAAKIRRLLGYADRNRDSYWLLESVLASIEEGTETEIRTLLTRADAIETQLAGSSTRAGLKRAEDVEWYAAGEVFGSLRDEGDRIVSQIAALLNIEIRQSAFRPRAQSGPCGRA